MQRPSSTFKPLYKKLKFEYDFKTGELKKIALPLKAKPDFKVINQKPYISDSDKINYVVSYEPNTSICELWGLRKTQEDRALAGLLQNMEALDEVNRHLVFKRSFAALQQKIVLADKGYRTGSCLCSAVVCNNSVYTSHIGDSTAFLAVVNEEKGDVVEFRRLNHELHNAKSRLDGTLNLAQALGDRFYEEYGLTHVGEIRSDKLPTLPKHKVFIIVACDGLTEGNLLTLDAIKLLIAQNHKKPPEDIAQILAIEALKAGSRDNITTGVLLFDPASKTTKYLVVLDGHGGDEVSEFLSQHYHETLQAQINFAIQRKKESEAQNNQVLTLLYNQIVLQMNELFTRIPEDKKAEILLVFDQMLSMKTSPDKLLNAYDELTLFLGAVQFSVYLLKEYVGKEEKQQEVLQQLQNDGLDALKKFDAKKGNAEELMFDIMVSLASLEKRLDPQTNLAKLISKNLLPYYFIFLSKLKNRPQLKEKVEQVSKALKQDPEKGKKEFENFVRDMYQQVKPESDQKFFSKEDTVTKKMMQALLPHELKSSESKFQPGA